MMLDLASKINKDKFDVIIVSMTKSDGALKSFNYSNSNVFLLDFRHSLINSYVSLFKIIRDFNPTIVHAHMFHAGVCAFIFKIIFGMRFILCFTGHKAVHSRWRRMFLWIFRKFRDADIIFSENVKSFVDAPVTYIIPNGVFVPPEIPTRERWSAKTGIIFVSVGRLVWEKDYLGLVNSFARASIDGATLKLVGDGPLKDEIHSLIKRLAIEDRVKICGFSEYVRDHLRSSHIFVLHSAEEGLPMALLEAGAEGLPVISTPVGSIPEILSDQRGALASQREFWGVMRKIASNPGDSLAMGLRLRNYIRETCSIEIMVSSYQRLYLNLAERKLRG